MSEGAPVTLRIAEKVAEREGVDPTDLSPPLYDVVDTEALEALFRSTDGAESGDRVRVEFPYGGYDVRVDGSGAVRVTKSSRRADSTRRTAGELSGD